MKKKSILLRVLSILITSLSLTTFSYAQTKLPTVDCVINPSKVINISAPVAGIIQSITVEQGDWVEKGQLIAALGSAVEQANVNLAQTRTTMLADLQSEEINYKFDRLQVKRIQQLANKKLASNQNKDEAERLKQLSYSRVKLAKEQLRLRKLELLRAQAQLDEKKVHSTITGVVLERFKHEGEYVDGQPIVKLAQLDPLHVIAVFPIEYASQLKQGAQAKVFPEIDQKTGYSATVDRIDSIGDAASGTISIRLKIDNSQKKISAGLKCFLQITES